MGPPRNGEKGKIMYEIVIAQPGEFEGHAAGNWSAEAAGIDNEFSTIEEAQQAITELRTMGGSWATATFAVQEIGARYPELGTIDRPST